jgi:hypothetical protein
MPLQRLRFHLAAGAGAGHVDVDGLAVDVDQLDVAVVALQCGRTDSSRSSSMLADALQVGELAGLGHFLGGVGAVRPSKVSPRSASTLARISSMPSWQDAQPPPALV